MGFAVALKQKCMDFYPDFRPTASNLKAEFEEIIITKIIPDNPETSQLVERFVLITMVSCYANYSHINCLVT